jgi:N-acetylglucosamine-6-phosphate deacetylase
MKLVYKLKGPDRLALITDSMRAAGTNVTESYIGSIDGGNPVIIEDGVAKLKDRSYFAGSIVTADKVIQNAYFKVGLPLNEVVRMMSLTPCRILGLDKRKGSLEKGKDADIVIFDDKLNVKSVYIQGKLMFSV